MHFVIWLVAGNGDIGSTKTIMDQLL